MTQKASTNLVTWTIKREETRRKTKEGYVTQTHVTATV